MIAFSQDPSLLEIWQIADLVLGDWEEIPKTAETDLVGMALMRNIEDSVGPIEGSKIVANFLSNATGWKGSLAKRVKADLRRRLDDHYMDRLEKCR
jgi:hypothetical protein